jgi:hypothetical protein
MPSRQQVKLAQRGYWIYDFILPCGVGALLNHTAG